MPLPTTGPIALSDVNTILSYTSTSVIALNDTIVRSLFQKPLGTIAMSDGRGKATGGSQSYLTAGTFYFTVPAYLTLTVTVNGAGGGGEGGDYKYLIDIREAADSYGYYRGGNGGTGGASSFNSPTPLVGNGGIGGNVDGTASGGSTNTTGGGAAGGAGGISRTDGLGDAPTTANGVKGGEGGLSYREWSRDAGGPTIGSVISVVVGAGGLGGSKGTGVKGSAFSGGSNGGTGSVLITWT